eukprot:TRINITY_DN49484_c0_g1_i1.p1 TRINITY_DN49484_c0_g1~~TRINITY_DN49484_c0_g1_i1.p1  ORF type:complete len:650 (-),score=67.13 TRINITY_DN49484_c0_g1_i1:1038-2987(-)
MNSEATSSSQVTADKELKLDVKVTEDGATTPGLMQLKRQGSEGGRIVWKPHQGITRTVGPSSIKDIKVNRQGTEGNNKIAKMQLKWAKKDEQTHLYIIEFESFYDRDQCLDFIQEIRKSKKEAKRAEEKDKGFIPPVPLPNQTAQLKLRLLSRDAELRSLHDYMVRSRVITEDEFWSTRQHLLLEERDREKKQKTGMRTPYFLTDVGTKLNAKETQVTINLNRQTIADIFREHPSVKEAFAENVPKKLTEQQFWERFFKSHHFNRRVTAQAQTEADIFKEADTREKERKKELELKEKENPKQQDPTAMQLDSRQGLTGTSGTSPGFTWKNGYGIKDYLTPHEKQKNQTQMPSIVKKFNKHSHVVLQPFTHAVHPDTVPNCEDVIESSSALKRKREDCVGELSDLEEYVPSVPLSLNVSDRGKYFNAGAVTTGHGEHSTGARSSSSAPAMKPLPADQHKAMTQAICVELETPKVAVPNTTGFDPCFGPIGGVKKRETSHNSATDDDTVYRERVTSFVSRAHEALRHYWTVSTSDDTDDQLRMEKEKKLISNVVSLERDISSEIAKIKALELNLFAERGRPYEALQRCLAAALQRFEDGKFRKVKHTTHDKTKNEQVEKPHTGIAGPSAAQPTFVIRGSEKKPKKKLRGPK